MRRLLEICIRHRFTSNASFSRWLRSTMRRDTARHFRHRGYTEEEIAAILTRWFA